MNKENREYTPAPWRYEESTRTIRSVPANYWLASMNSWDGAVNHEANARLIAAAPDMLQALKTVLTLTQHTAADPRVRRLILTTIESATRGLAAPISERKLVCSCCQGDAGRWRQHWNRASGYGVCVTCVTSMRLDRMPEDEIESYYGRQGVNWGRTHWLHGRLFQVTAATRTQDDANAWMLLHSADGLLATVDGVHLMTRMDNSGEPVTDPK